jgi:hypothetical protein
MTDISLAGLSLNSGKLLKIILIIGGFLNSLMLLIFNSDLIIHGKRSAFCGVYSFNIFHNISRAYVFTVNYFLNGYLSTTLFTSSFTSIYD